VTDYQAVCFATGETTTSASQGLKVNQFIILPTRMRTPTIFSEGKCRCRLKAFFITSSCQLLRGRTNHSDAGTWVQATRMRHQLKVCDGTDDRVCEPENTDQLVMYTAQCT